MENITTENNAMHIKNTPKFSILYNLKKHSYLVIELNKYVPQPNYIHVNV